MYCPKCKDTFEEGSRRFCPADGSRLVSDPPNTANPRSSSIFANLIPRIEAAGRLDEKLASEKFIPPRHSAPPIPEPNLSLDSGSGPYFELDDTELDVPPLERASPEPGVRAEPKDTTRPPGRKILPSDIPAGHVDLHAENRFPSPAEDFSFDNPERFVGRTVKGRYFVTEFLGGDESGLAYLGDDRLASERKVLVRVLVDESYDPILSSMLAEERVSLSHFSHPNVARMIDSGEFSNGLTFLVSEYVDALSVNDILTIHGKFNEQRAARIIRQASVALSEAHQEGIIHRDIRPENLIVDSTGDTEQLRVVNFGASGGEPNPHNIGYKAPEVLEGRIATVASDIYSLAVVAFEMMTGEMPFHGDSERDYIRSQSCGLARLPSLINPSLPPSINEVFDRGLAFNPADRYPKARDLGDALATAISQPVFRAVSEEPKPGAEPMPAVHTPSDTRSSVLKKGPVISLEPVAPAPPVVESSSQKDEPNWKNRSPEPPVVESTRHSISAVAGILALLCVVAGIWYLVTSRRVPETTGSGVNISSSPIATPSTELPPLPRQISQPPDTNFYQNNKTDLKGDLLRNFVGFTLYYPKDWKVNGPQNGSSPNRRGKFLDISSFTADGRVKEQMLISYYPSRGIFDLDSERFPQLVKETNETLTKILPGYQMVSEGEIMLNQNWRAYEIKFQGGGTSEKGEKLVVWGRRLFVPAARPGTRNGFEITMLATSYAEGVNSVDDVGVKGQLAGILETFEPGQNF